MVTTMIIIASSFQLAFDDPLSTDHQKVVIMNYLDYVFTGKSLLNDIASVRLYSKEDRQSVRFDKAMAN